MWGWKYVHVHVRKVNYCGEASVSVNVFECTANFASPLEHVCTDGVCERRTCMRAICPRG